MIECPICKGEGKTQSEPLTFGDLELGDKFVFWPLDGDDSGHGGFRSGGYVFVKRRHPPGAVRVNDGVTSSTRDTAMVLKVLI